MTKNKAETTRDSSLQDRFPNHIAIIMDGNGRWAKQRSLPTILGHREGASTLKRIARHANDLGVKYLTAWAFSTENWRRPEAWINDMMGLLRYYLKNEVRELTSNNIRLRILGDKSAFAPDIQELMTIAEESTLQNTGLNLMMALNYGGKKDILRACKEVTKHVHSQWAASFSNKKVPVDVDLNSLEPFLDQITEETFSSFLYTKDIPDPDLLIRTSGEYRLSNYLLWQLAYSELVFYDKLWPDFNEDDLEDAIQKYKLRDRRFGATFGE